MSPKTEESTPHTKRKTLTVEFCAEFCGVSPRTIKDWGLNKRRFDIFNPAYGIYRVYEDSFERFLQRRTLRAKL